MSATLTELRTDARNQYLKIDPNWKIWSNDTLDYYINRWFTKVQEDFQYSIPECQTSTTITTVAGTTEYSKPSDFVKITGLFDDSYELNRITKQDYLRNRPWNSKPSNYYLYGSKIWLYPTPDSTYSLDLLYNKKLPTLTSSVGSDLDDDMNDLVVLRACYLMLISVEKIEKAQMILWQYTVQKDSLVNEKLNDDDSLTFDLQRNTARIRDDAVYY